MKRRKRFTMLLLRPNWIQTVQLQNFVQAVRAYQHKISRMDPDSCRCQWVSQDVWWGEEAIDWILPLWWVPRQKRTPWCSSNLGTNCISPSFSPTASNPVSQFRKLLSWVVQKHPVLCRMSVCHYASSVRLSHCRCFNLQCSLQSVQARSIWCTDTFKKIIRSTKEANLHSSVKRERLKKVNALIKEPDFRANELQGMIRSAIGLTQT